MRTVIQKIPAGQEVEIAVGKGCGYLRLVASTGNAPIIITDADTGFSFPLEAGDDAQLAPVQRIRIGHAETSEITAQLLIGSPGEKTGSNKIAGAIDATIVKPTTMIKRKVLLSSYTQTTLIDENHARLGWQITAEYQIMLYRPGETGTHEFLNLWTGEVYREEFIPWAPVEGMTDIGNYFMIEEYF